MQELYYKSKKKSIKPLPKIVKCCSLKCKSSGNLDTKNVEKYAQCESCQGYEHFNCANIRDEGKSKYINGHEKFRCSSCFLKNPRGLKNRSIEMLTLEEAATDIPEVVDYNKGEEGLNIETEVRTQSKANHDGICFRCDKCEFFAQYRKTYKNTWKSIIRLYAQIVVTQPIPPIT